LIRSNHRGIGYEILGVAAFIVGGHVPPENRGKPGRTVAGRMPGRLEGGRGRLALGIRYLG
jgi:hypothetical protein